MDLETYNKRAKINKMFIEKRYFVLCRIRDDTVYVEYILDCRRDYGWLDR